MPLVLQSTPIDGVFVVNGTQIMDDRGSFARLFCAVELAPRLADRRIVQINHSRTRKTGAVRGLHYQRPPHAEMKFVRCMRGKVWDVVVDLRAGSPTFLRWHAEELSAEVLRMVIVPEGCAHGFQTLEADSEMLYLHTAPFAPSSESGLRFDDPRLAIPWPLLPTDVSVRDRAHALIDATFTGLLS